MVGGQCRKVGKTALVVDLMRCLDDLEWCAVKITSHAEWTCPVNGPTCKCGSDEHTFAIREERDPTGTGDTGRFLAAGARRAIWLEAKEGRIRDALSALAGVLESARPVIIESNTIVEFWRPDLFLMVVDPGKSDFKPSAQNVMPFVHAFVCRSPYTDLEVKQSLLREFSHKRKFVQLLGEPVPEGVQILARQRITGSCHQTSTQGKERPGSF